MFPSFSHLPKPRAPRAPQVCQAIGHERQHGHRPILQLAYSGGATRFELLLYHGAGGGLGTGRGSLQLREGGMNQRISWF